MQRSIERVKIDQDFMAAVSYLKKYEPSTRKLGIVGSCFGGYVSNMLATTVPELIDAEVPFTAPQQKAI